MAEQTVICPKCGKRITLSKALRHQISSELRGKIDEELKNSYEKKLERTLKTRERLEKQKLKNQLESEKVKLKRQANKEAEGRNASKVADLQSRLTKQESVIAKAKNDRTKIDRDRAALDERKNALDNEVKKKVKSALVRAETEITDRVENEFQSRELELRKKLDDAKMQASDLKRKLEQSSQQLQGEVIEIELQKILKHTFPGDKIESIGVGKRGADVLQHVHSPNGDKCGSILWESKNTQKWSPAWLKKLKTDQRRERADIAVLVTLALPKGTRHFSQVADIWVTQFQFVLGLATAFRLNLVEIASLKASKRGKTEKLELLFDYLSSPTFRQRIETIVEAFQDMQDELEKERNQMQKHWNSREEQIQSVIENISGMYGDMQSIASLPKIRRLQLPG